MTSPVALPRGLATTWRAPSRWIVAVDVGQAIDPTAIAVMEIVARVDADRSKAITPHDLDMVIVAEQKAPGGLASIDVRHLERLPLRMPYPEQIAHVAALLRRSPLDRLQPELVIDQTGVGRPVVDMFRHAGLRPIAITITAGDGEGKGAADDDYRVSKLMLVSRLQAALHAGELRIAKDLKEASALVEELQNFRANISDAGVARFGARSGKHDDLVLAVGIGAHWASRPKPTVAFTSLGL